MRYRQLSSLARSWSVENRVLTAVGVRGFDISRRPSLAARAALSVTAAGPCHRKRPAPLPGEAGERDGTDVANSEDDQTQPRFLQASATRLTEMT